MKKAKKILTTMLLFLMFIPLTVKADSGLDADYDAKSISDIFGSLTSLLSPLIEMISAKPGDTDYKTYHIIAAVICIIIFYVVLNINMIKLTEKKKKTIVILGLNIMPTLIFSLLCLLIKLPIIIYVLVITIYIIIFNIVTKKTLKKRVEEKINIVKEKDKEFNLDKINEDTFNAYKDIQIAWMNNDLNSIKDIISEEIFNKYKEKLDKLQQDNEKNIMDKIEFISNELTNITIDKNIETIECKMNITCIDYIVNNEEKVVKGKKDKINKYTYKLVFNRNIKNNKYVLIEKKVLKQK